MKTLLYRGSLDVRSGAGQLILIQMRALEAAGARVALACRRGGLKFLLRTGRRAKRLSAKSVRDLESRGGWRIVDHGAEIPEAEFVFVHNLHAEAGRYAWRAELRDSIDREAAFFAALRGDATVVANSRLVKAALIERFGLAPERVAVQYPGFRSARFRARDSTFRARARASLGVSAESPLLGFVTSGDFRKRGLDRFLETAELIARSAPEARFLVVGSKRLPDDARRHPLVASGTLRHRPKSPHPERWFAAFDVFLYPAHFEEFGMVILEAQASGLPVLTSRRVGASECLPAAYARWLVDAPDPAAFAALALELLGDRQTRAALGAAGAESVAAFDERAYARATIELLMSSEPVR